VNTIKELLERRNSISGIENHDYSRRDPSRWQRSKKLALASPTSDGHSVGIVRSRTQATDFSDYLSATRSVRMLKWCFVGRNFAMRRSLMQEGMNTRSPWQLKNLLLRLIMKRTNKLRLILVLVYVMHNCVQFTPVVPKVDCTAPWGALKGEGLQGALQVAPPYALLAYLRLKSLQNSHRETGIALSRNLLTVKYSQR
jgi:hypothetical protein